MVCTVVGHLTAVARPFTPAPRTHMRGLPDDMLVVGLLRCSYVCRSSANSTGEAGGM